MCCENLNNVPRAEKSVETGNYTCLQEINQLQVKQNQIIR